MATAAPSITAEHIQLLRSQPHLYAQTNLWIRTKPEAGQPSRLSTLEYNLAQRILHAKAEQQKARTGRVRGIVLKARQEGVSTWVGSRTYHGCTLWGRRRAKVLADKLDRAGEIFEIYERFDAENPIRPRKTVSRKARELAWDIDSKITVETAQDKDAGRGGTNDFVHASEFAGWPYPADTLAGLLESIPADAGEAWIESTAKGVGNDFHAMWEMAVAGESEWMPVFLPWWIDEGYRLELDDEGMVDITTSLTEWEANALTVGIRWEETPDEVIPAVLPSGAWFDIETQRWRLQPEQLAWRRRKIREGSEKRFQQENPSTSEEAFLVSGSPFFDMPALEKALERTRPPIHRGNFVLRQGTVAWADGGERGFVRIWEDPDPNGHYVIAADTAEGRMSEGTTALLTGLDSERGGRDFSSADVLKVSEIITGPGGSMIRVPCCRQVAQIHGREGLPPDTLGAQLFAASAWWSCPPLVQGSRQRELALIGPERNHSSGQTVIRCLLEEHHHPNVFIHHRPNRRDDVVALEYGWITDPNTRPLMLDELEAAVRTGQIEIFCADTIREMRTFVRGGGRAEEGKADDGKPEAQKGCHDDRVISLAIALQMRQYHHGAGQLPPQPEPEADLSFVDGPRRQGYDGGLELVPEDLLTEDVEAPESLIGI